MTDTPSTPRPLKRAKSWAECDDNERRAIDAFYIDCPPSNMPPSKHLVWWSFDRKGNAGWII